jgi:hypothetical protein
MISEMSVGQCLTSRGPTGRTTTIISTTTTTRMETEAVDSTKVREGVGPTARKEKLRTHTVLIKTGVRGKLG